MKILSAKRVASTVWLKSVITRGVQAANPTHGRPQAVTASDCKASCGLDFKKRTKSGLWALIQFIDLFEFKTGCMQINMTSVLLHTNKKSWITIDSITPTGENACKSILAKQKYRIIILIHIHGVSLVFCI